MANNGISVPEMAAELLKNHKGVQRNAEAAAWEAQSGYSPQSDYYKLWRDVAICNLEGQEVPAIPRKEHIPTPAFKQVMLPTDVKQ
jgi:hypothetical protein